MGHLLLGLMRSIHSPQFKAHLHPAVPPLLILTSGELGRGPTREVNQRRVGNILQVRKSVVPCDDELIISYRLI